MEYIKSVFKKKEKLTYFTIYTLIMFLMCFVVFSYFIIRGKSLIWREDGLFQHYISLRYYRNYIIEILNNIFIKHEFLIPMWDFTIGQGSDIITTFLFSLRETITGSPSNAISKYFFIFALTSICFVAIIMHLFPYLKPYRLLYLYYMLLLCTSQQNLWSKTAFIITTRSLTLSWWVLSELWV